MSNIRTTPPQTGFFARMVQLLAATDNFVVWWGEHRAWPANESPRIGAAALMRRTTVILANAGIHIL